MSRPACSRAEGDFAAPVRWNDYRRWPSEIEILAIPDVGLDDPPAADEFTAHRRSHADAAMIDGRPIGEYSAA